MVQTTSRGFSNAAVSLKTNGQPVRFKHEPLLTANSAQLQAKHSYFNVSISISQPTVANSAHFLIKLLFGAKLRNDASTDELSKWKDVSGCLQASQSYLVTV